MKTLFVFLKKTFYNTAAIYMLTSVFYIFTFFAASDEDAAHYGAVNLFLYSLLFAFLAALVLSVFGLFSKMPSLIKYGAEFILCYAAFYVSLFSLTGNSRNFPALFAMSTVFVLIYAAGGTIVLLTEKNRRERQSAAEYENVYDEAADK